MTRLQYWIMIAAFVSSADCSAVSHEEINTQDQAAIQDHASNSWRARYLELGRETYESACASCHDDNREGAPTKGDRDSWSDRSPLWSAVLLEHAKSGYLGMPCKGGRTELSDRAVEAAGEYMLMETFPELLRD